MVSQQKQLNQRLIESVITRDVTQVKLLLKQGAEANYPDSEHNETPLILAVKFADNAMINLLLEAGAEINAQDDKGRTALFYADVLSDKFQLLLSAGATPHIKDKEKNSLLMCKISESVSLDEVKSLLMLGVDSTCRNDNGETASDLAEQLGLLKVIDWLRGL